MATLKIDILTLFPDFFRGPLTVSMVKRAVDKKKLGLKVHDLRRWTADKRRTADDVTFGGGAGMVLKPEPLVKALTALKRGRKGVKTLLMSPQGRKFDHATALELLKEKGLILVCGHYEGVDERVMDWIDGEISLGDYVLSGGEPAAAVLVDSLARLLPGVVGDERSVREDSFFHGLLDHPHYTRPRSFKGREVPDVLMSGDHAKIAKWRKAASLRNTLRKRPDLLEKADLDPEARRLLEDLRRELEEEKT